MGKKTYEQYCALAKALDHIGDRWTLLIVRELLVAPCRYSEIRASLPGIATNLLADRLRQLVADGIVERDAEKYRLTAFGRELQNTVSSLVRWGGRWMVDREADDHFRPEWLVVALRALLPGRRKARLQLNVEGGTVHLERASIGLGPIGAPDAIVTAPADVLLGAITGKIPLSALDVAGDIAVVEAAFPFSKAPRDTSGSVGSNYGGAS